MKDLKIAVAGTGYVGLSIANVIVIARIFGNILFIVHFSC